jgi:DNA-directed RNA polymerase subunit RPC12/RpoP
MTYRCNDCGQTFVAWAPAERHSRESGHVRIVTEFPERKL